MNYTIIKKLPSSDEIIRSMPLSEKGHQSVMQDRLEIKNILEGKDPRKLIIVGPCSAWPETAVLEYAEKLVGLKQRLKNSLKIVMRVYIQKPRTTKGWTGPVNQPDPLGNPDIAAGVKYTREMMIKVIEMGLPIADEALFTHNAKCFLELLSWVAIGARSTEDQEHRIFASAIDCAVGMKNPTHGSLKIAANSIIAAQHPHVAVFDGNEVQTHGNPYAHVVLRGTQHSPNYSIAHLEEMSQHLKASCVKNPGVIIDASHDNCVIKGKKDHRHQSNVVLDVMESLKNRPDLKKLVKGFMIESFIKEGNQSVESQRPLDLCGLSITDPCLSWEHTEALMVKLAEEIRNGN